MKSTLAALLFLIFVAGDNASLPMSFGAEEAHADKLGEWIDRLNLPAPSDAQFCRVTHISKEFNPEIVYGIVVARVIGNHGATDPRRSRI